MKILITGARGLLGGALAAALATEGYDVVITGREAVISEGLDIVYVFADLANPDDVGGLFSHGPFDAIVHAAARIRAENKADFIRDNVTATTNVAQAAAQAGVRCCVFFSTISVYSGEGPFYETSPATSTDGYGASKREAESNWLMLATDGAIVLRLAGLHGAPRCTGVVHQIVAQAQTNTDIRLEEPETLVTLTFIDDVVAVVSQILRAQELPTSRVFNLATKEAVTYRKMAETLSALLDSKSAIVTPFNARIRNRILDTTRIRTELNPRLMPLAVHLQRVANIAVKPTKSV